MAPAMSCKTCKKSKHGETRSKTNDFKSNEIKKGRSHGARHGKNRRTKRVPYSLECVEEMLQDS